MNRIYFTADGGTLYVFLADGSAWVAHREDSCKVLSRERNFVYFPSRNVEWHQINKSKKLCVARANRWLKDNNWNITVKQILEIQTS